MDMFLIDITGLILGITAVSLSNKLALEIP